MKTYYIIVETGDDASTYGIYTTREKASEEIKKIYKNGFFGELIICEDELREEQ